MPEVQIPPEMPQPMKLQRVDDHHPFRKLQTMENTYDVEFCACDERFQAHRIVVAESSPCFEKLLFVDINLSNEEEVSLSKFSPQTWRAALNFIYGGEVDLSTTPLANILELHECAADYQLDNLKRAVMKGLTSSTSESNFCERLNIAEQIGSSALKEAVLEFVGNEFKRLRESEATEAKVPQPMILRRFDEQHPFRKLRSMDHTFDIVFRIGDERLQAHRIIVAGASLYFEKLLYNGMKESREEKVTLPKFSYQTWRVALDFIYGQIIDLSATPAAEVRELLECADYSQLDNLKHAVLNGLTSSIEEFNIRERFFLAELYECQTLKETAMQLVARKFNRLRELNAFNGFDLKLMQEILSCEFLKLRSELDVLRVIVAWLQNRPEIANESNTVHSENMDSSIASPGNELAAALTEHVRITDANTSDLREIGRLAGESKLHGLVVSCMGVFVWHEVKSSELTTPIPADLRVVHERNAKMISITHRLHFVEDWVVGKNHISPWMRDYRSDIENEWRLRVRVDLEEDEDNGDFERQVGFYIESEEPMEDRWVIQLFAHERDQASFHTTCEEGEKGENSYGFKNFISWNALCEELRDDPVVFGATIYY